MKKINKLQQVKTRLDKNRAEMKAYEGRCQNRSGRMRSWRFISKATGGVTIKEIEDGDSITLKEIRSVGAGLGGGLEHTSKLAIKTYNQAMQGPDKTEWTKEVVKEHKRILKNRVW